MDDPAHDDKIPPPRVGLLGRRDLVPRVSQTIGQDDGPSSVIATRP